VWEEVERGEEKRERERKKRASERSDKKKESKGKTKIILFERNLFPSLSELLITLIQA